MAAQVRTQPQDFMVVIEQDSDGWLVASVPSLPGCHTQARTHDELLARVREAILLCLDDEPEREALSLVGVVRVST